MSFTKILQIIKDITNLFKRHSKPSRTPAQPAKDQEADN